MNPHEEKLKTNVDTREALLGAAQALPAVYWNRDTQYPIAYFTLAYPSCPSQQGLGSGYTDANSIQYFWDNTVPVDAKLNLDTLVDWLTHHMQALHACQMTQWDYKTSEFPAISAIATAAFDLKARLAEQPLHTLLGLKKRNKILAYVTLIIDDVDDLEATIATYQARGFKAIKLYFPQLGFKPDHLTETDWHQSEAALIARARHAAGPDTQLMLDGYASNPLWTNGFDYAVRMAELLHQHQFLWYEDPLPPAQLKEYQILTATTDILISGGERLLGHTAFIDWIDCKAVDILQPDHTVAGGPITTLAINQRLSKQKEINQASISIIPHGWNNAIGLACDLHFLSTQPETSLCMVEYMPGFHNDELTTPRFMLDDDGYLKVPDGPGLGVEVITTGTQQY
ncbi:mandelate racemase/muconate lactonizing enzyme family protein [Eionea flava]